MAVLASGDVQAAAEHLVDTLVDKAREKAGDGVEVVGETVCGSPGAVLIARSGDASMIVVGSRGLGSVRGLLLGSVSRQVVQHAHCPVVVVPHAGRTREEPAA
jgi:nucleotide-binding universal stress UspA family protein